MVSLRYFSLTVGLYLVQLEMTSGRNFMHIWATTVRHGEADEVKEQNKAHADCNESDYEAPGERRQRAIGARIR